MPFDPPATLRPFSPTAFDAVGSIPLTGTQGSPRGEAPGPVASPRKGCAGPVGDRRQYGDDDPRSSAMLPIHK